MNARLGLKTGKPTDDIRSFVGELRKGAQRWGDLPPVILATLRKKMVDLAAEIADGAVWANAARSHMTESLARPASSGQAHRTRSSSSATWSRPASTTTAPPPPR